MSIEDDQMANIRSADMQRYIDECESCHDICLQVVVYCLRQGGRHAEVGHITTVLDCADMCATSANFMLRESTMQRRTCEVCAVGVIRFGGQVNYVVSSVLRSSL